MGRRQEGKENIRKLQRTGREGESYAVTLPIEFVKELGWQKKQKVVVKLVGNKLIISDWPS